MSYLHVDSFVLTRDRGFLRIKDVIVGDFILSRKTNTEDFYSEVICKYETEVDSYSRVASKNGTYINIQSSDDLLTHDEEYKSTSSNNLQNIIIPAKNLDVFNYDKNLSETGWFIGMHTGDGTCDRKRIVSKLRDYFKYRLRINGDNENIIKRYSDFINNELNSKTNYSISSRSDNKSTVWDYTKCSRDVELIVNKYFDGKFGNKTYSGVVYSYIINNNLWIPYIAGLMDADGAIKENGSLEISICMKSVIELLCNILSKSGIRYHVSRKTSVRQNETPLYRLTIYLYEEISTHICYNMGHEIKTSKIMAGDKNKFFSPYLYTIGKDVFDRIMTTKFKNQGSVEYGNAHTVKTLVKSRNGLLGLGGLVLYKNLGVISEEEYFEIIRREPIKEITTINESSNFISLETESGNYYAGNFGLMNVNC